jgi:uncharacterized membrane protein YoaK (UPF0700 family)
MTLFWIGFVVGAIVGVLGAAIAALWTAIVALWTIGEFSLFPDPAKH